MNTHSFAPLSRLPIMVAAFVALATSGAQAQPAPTTEHEVLKNDVGDWDGTMKLWNAPGEEPTTSECSEKVELLPGGMWIVTRFEGTFAGTPFTGASIIGYDPIEKKYVGTWVDSISPHLQTIRGDYDPATKTMTSIAENRDPATGKIIAYKEIARTIDANTRTFEMHLPDEKGNYRKIMEIEYKRRAE